MTTQTSRARVLAPVEKTDFRRNLRTRKVECWGALTEDGIWALVRQEDSMTSWDVVHRASGIVAQTHLSSLPACQEYIGSGDAGRDLERIEAEARRKQEGAVR